MTKEFNLVRQLRHGLGKAVYHVSLNLPYEDDLADKEFISLGWDYLKAWDLMTTNTSCTGISTKSISTSMIIGYKVKFSDDLVSDGKDYIGKEIWLNRIDRCCIGQEGIAHQERVGKSHSQGQTIDQTIVAS